MSLPLILLLTACPPKQEVDNHLTFDDAACFAEVARTLSSDEMDGRGTGTKGQVMAEQYIQQRFEAMGLQDLGEDGVQEVPVVLGVELGEGNSLAAGDSSFAVGEAWTPLGFSSNGDFEGQVVFVGYGIRAEELDYDDYADVDVDGKVLLAMRYEPGESDEASPFEGRMPTRWSDLRYKAMRAREAGAKALVFVTGPANASDLEQDGLPRLKPEGPTSVAGLPVLQVTRAVAQAWLEAGGQDLAQLQAAIDGDYTPHSVALDGVTVSGKVQLDPQKVTADNVLAVIPGTGDLADEYVMVGAHYDHLGHGGKGAMNPDLDAIHNGADDNASGVAAMVCAAQRLVAQTDGGQPRRSIVLAAWTAEEIGLGGSGWYSENPVVPLDDTVAMINMDMVGRVRDNKLQAMGTDSSPVWAEVLPALAEAEGLDLQIGGDGYGPSDHMSFYTKGIPVVHLFSGSHTEYHSPQDDFDTLNVDGGAQVTRLVAAATQAIATRDERLAFVKGSSGSPMLGDSRGYGSYLGTIPDYTTMSEATGGVLLSGVREGGPADLAGMQEGDRLVGLGDYSIANLYDMTFALRDHKPGEIVDLKVLRDGEELTLRATLKSREGEAGKGGGHGGASSPTWPQVPGPDWTPKAGKAADQLIHADEEHFKNLRQLTFGGDNAEAYWSPDGTKLIFQTPPSPDLCDQQWIYDLETGEKTLVSSGKGRTTCGYYDWSGGPERYIYATTEAGGDQCPPPPDMSKGYTWAIYDDFDLVWQDPGGQPVPFLPSPGYDAEATACFVDGTIVFTSVRDGDLELYTVQPDGSELTRMTHTPGYDGGAFFSHDCSQIVWRASRPEGEKLADYQSLLDQALVRPSEMELFVMDRDGSNVKQLTHNSKANFGPYFMPNDEGIIFASNMGGSVREFDLWAVGLDGGEPEQITKTEGFDGFPMFSPDGRWLIFASNRGGDGRETNLFIAEWVD